MKKSNIIVVVMSIISVCLTFFAPLAKQTVDAFFSSYSETFSLFSGVVSDACVTLTVISGIGLLLFPILSLVSKQNSKIMIGTRVFGILLLVMQVVCAVSCLGGEDDSTLLGALVNEVMQVSIHPLFIVTMLCTLVSIVVSFFVKPNVNSEEVPSDGE